jgi:hypothetical protein
VSKTRGGPVARSTTYLAPLDGSQGVTGYDGGLASGPRFPGELPNPSLLRAYVRAFTAETSGNQPKKQEPGADGP